MIKILVVDDEQAILDEAFEALTDEGYQAFCAKSVDDALDILRKHTDIGVVVTDLKMPGKTGADLINRAQAEFERDISFIVMSGHGSPTIESDGLEIEKFPFLRKPLDIDEFLDAVQKVASSKSVPDEDERRKWPTRY